MKLNVRFLALVVALVLAIGIIERQGAQALDRLNVALERVVDSDMERVFAITHVRRLFRSMVLLEGDYLLAKADAERASMDKKMEQLAKEQLEQIEKYARLMPKDDANAISDIRAVRQRFIARDTNVRSLAATDHDGALALSKQHAKDPVNWEKVIGGLVKLSEQRLAAQVRETHEIHATAKRTLSIVAVFATLLAFGLGVVIYLGIRKNVAEVLRVNANLERLVGERTAALVHREHALRLVLDSTGDAFIEIDRHGKVCGEPSAAAVKWFGPLPRYGSAAEYLFPDDKQGQKQFSAAFAQLIDDILPWELTSEQMPKRQDIGSISVEFEYKQVYEKGTLARVLVVARDISSRIQAEAAERNAREQQAVIGKLLSDKTGFAQFVDDCESLISDLSTEHETNAIKRIIHTLKGNTAIFGLSSIADYCHKLETLMSERQDIPTAEAIADLAALFRTRMESLEGFLSGISRDSLEIESEEHERLIESLLHRKDYEELLSMVEIWTWYRASDRLARLRAQTEYVARRLGKEVSVVVEHNNLRIPKDYLVKFWPFLVHVTRNAVDHGIEHADERLAQGKAATGTVTLRTLVQGDKFVVEIRDDGAGINLPKLVESARQRKVAVADGATVLDLVCADGLSTRELVTDVSGRGIGMAAVRQACEADGGQLRIVTDPGKGSSFQFIFRMPVVKTGLLAERVVRRWSLVPPNAIGVESRGSQTLERALNLKNSQS